MTRKNIGTPLDRINRNNHNQNYIELYDKISDLFKGISDEVYKQLRDDISIKWKGYVDNHEDLPNDAENADTYVLSDGFVYRYDGKNWVKIQEIDINLFDVIQTDLNDQVQKMVSKESMVNFDINNFEEIYMYDMELSQSTVNQGLVINEMSREIYASQAISSIGNDKVQSFYINRLSLSGEYLDHMTIRRGGHGTSFGIETEGDTVYIWSSMINVDSDGNKDGYYLCRYPYQPNSEVNLNSPYVEKYIELPDNKHYMTPFSDDKNGLLALRYTNSNKNNISDIKVYNVEDIKNDIYDNVIYSFEFTQHMNESLLQGLTLDDNLLYLSFGVDANDFELFEIDMVTQQIIGNHDEPIGKNNLGEFDFDFGEPEGMFLYTDKKTKKKTLYHVIVTGQSGKRRQRLIALSSNEGYKEFLGKSLERFYKYSDSIGDDTTKVIDWPIANLSEIKSHGNYYITTNKSNEINDHPRKGISGWFFNVSKEGGNKTRIQELIRNSSNYVEKHIRTCNDESCSDWTNIPYKPIFKGDWTNYYDDDRDNLTYQKNDDGTVSVSGIIKNEKDTKGTGVVFTLPAGYKPSKNIEVPVAASGTSISNIRINSNGDVEVTKILSISGGGAGGTANYIHLNISFNTMG